ncbi:uncharacterized protein OCT59_028711 [Rhizophagus irregularis]|uniref:uncharacterized protein n=1 Tax=Rhizophagus irregularis TaxID=588596 RepID=UPI001A07854B|nr:hypothetical protein OCT59_028711 [Rhizophagus irregularis]GBC52669.2 hypothetical protein GLOIN_2v1527487 [Rhizophagus irregularis DAOM 181602=DAOM 197198]CAG8723267.1 12662_t:CDS:2 [Rhizophagus irregularis]
MQYLLFKLIFSTALIIIFNYIKFANCKLFFTGGTGYKSIFTGNKLYYLSFPEISFFYVDLTGVSLDSDTHVDQSKWIDLTDIKPRPERTSTRPVLGGKVNDQIMFFDSDDGKSVTANSFDTTPKQWIINQNVKSLTPGFFSDLNGWVSDGKTGKAYTFDSINKGMTILDTINLSVGSGISTPKNLFAKKSTFYDDFVQVMIPNGQILFIGGKLGNEHQSMKSLLTYDSNKDTWQITNTVGAAPQERTKHTAVSTSDGRVILFGGIINNVPALPQLAVLDTSKAPYQWVTLTEEDPIGAFSEHTAVMANNYMIFAFGKNESETKELKSNNKDIYKLNISDPLKYKWSLLASFEGKPTSTTSSNSSSSASTPIQTDVSVGNSSFSKNFELKARWVVTIVVVIVALICISIFAVYRTRQYRNKNRVKNTYQHKLSSNDELDKNYI